MSLNESDPAQPPFEPALAVSSLSGQSDATWAKSAADFVGCAFLGGIALDAASRAAARDLVERERQEFLPADPMAFIDDQLADLESVPIRSAVNLRSATIDPIREAASICASHDAIVEVNAHCRQPELCAVGCGETLLRDTARLRRIVSAAGDSCPLVSVKVRAGVPGVDLVETASAVTDAGADIIHVDAMDSEPVIEEIVRATDCFVIANNGVRDHETVTAYLEYGADAVSVGRPSDDPRVLGRVAEAVEQYSDRRVDQSPGASR